jgi:hypothetical protein
MSLMLCPFYFFWCMLGGVEGAQSHRLPPMPMSCGRFYGVVLLAAKWPNVLLR